MDLSYIEALYIEDMRSRRTIKIEYRYPYVLTGDYYIKLHVEEAGRIQLLRIINGMAFQDRDNMFPISDIPIRDLWKTDRSVIGLGADGSRLLGFVESTASPILIICGLDLPYILILEGEKLDDIYLRGRAYILDIFLRRGRIFNYYIKLPMKLIVDDSYIGYYDDGRRIFLLVR